MPNISLEELQKTLEKSGLPFGSSFDMKQAQVGAGQAIRGNVGDHGAGGFNKGIMAQLDQIAQMDRKLAGTYSDPTSQLYIENPIAREGAIYGHRGTGFKQVGALAESRDDALQAQEDEAREAERLYSDLTSAQAQVEAEQKRITAQTKKKQNEAKKKANTVKTESGGDFELSKQQVRQARNAKVDLKDPKAVSEFFNKSPAAFRNYMEDEGIDGKIKADNLTAKQIKEMKMKWEGEVKKKQVKTAVEKSNIKKKETSKSKGSKKALF